MSLNNFIHFSVKALYYIWWGKTNVHPKRSKGTSISSSYESCLFNLLESICYSLRYSSFLFKRVSNIFILWNNSYYISNKMTHQNFGNFIDSWYISHSFQSNRSNAVNASNPEREDISLHQPHSLYCIKPSGKNDTSSRVFIILLMIIKMILSCYFSNHFYLI